MKRAIAYLTANPARFFLVAAIFWIIIMGILNAKEGIQWDDILVEANGMVFDLLVFGVLLSVYESLRQKRDKIERLKEEIDDYRHWDEKEATFRIIGAVKRLNKLGVSEIDLDLCFLQMADLSSVNLERANLSRANLSEANFSYANLSDADFDQAIITGVCFERANLTRTYFVRQNLSRAKLSGADLRKAHLEGANLSNSDLSGANLEDAYLNGAIFEGVNLEGAKTGKTIFGNPGFTLFEVNQIIGLEEIKLKYFVDEEGIIRKK